MNNYDNVVLTYKCKYCGKLNRIRNPKDGLKWKCGNCKQRILYREEVFNENLILDIRYNLENILLRLKSIRSSLFSQKEINELNDLTQKFISKVESWKEHVGYIKDRNEQLAILRSYEPDLNEITTLSVKISKEIDNKKWLNEKIKNLDSVKSLIDTTICLISNITTLLNLIGAESISNYIYMLLKISRIDLKK